MPVDVPASFTFVAGHESGDRGSLTLTQTGRRGIGTATLDFTVEPQAVQLTIRSETFFSPVEGAESAGVFTVETTLPAGADGVFAGAATWTLDGTFGYSEELAFSAACQGPLTGTGPMTLRATPDPEDGAALTLTAEVEYGSYPAQCRGQGAGDPNIFAQILTMTFEDSLQDVSLTVDGPAVSTTGTGRGSTAATTATARRP